MTPSASITWKRDMAKRPSDRSLSCTSKRVRASVDRPEQLVVPVIPAASMPRARNDSIPALRARSIVAVSTAI
jgi:hypothetical protein